MNKQIEEMAIDLSENIVEVWNAKWNQYVIDGKATAENMIKEGYRKTSYVASEIFAEIDELLNSLEKNNPCDYMLKVVIEKFKALKKKYESKDANNEALD